MLGPLATQAEPHCYDLCRTHASALSAPRGWEVIRLAADPDPRPSSDDLLALADAVREAARPVPQHTSQAAAAPVGVPLRPESQTGRRGGHLRSVPDLEA